MPECKYGDALCPCQDGDQCHYEGKNPMTPPRPEFIGGETPPPPNHRWEQPPLTPDEIDGIGV